MISGMAFPKSGKDFYGDARDGSPYNYNLKKKCPGKGHPFSWGPMILVFWLGRAKVPGRFRPIGQAALAGVA
jgi:hypothetical protein